MNRDNIKEIFNNDFTIEKYIKFCENNKIKINEYNSLKEFRIFTFIIDVLYN